MGALRNAANRLVSPLGWSVIKQSRREQVSAVLSLLHAVDSGHELIRIGGERDGGYLLPDDLGGVIACFSPGVGDSSRFELALEERGIRSFLADASVKGPCAGAEHMDFTAKFLGASTHGNVISLDDWVAEKSAIAGAGDLLLQMDIEGAEYETLLAASDDTLRRFRVLALELHGLDQVGQEYARRLIGATLAKLGRHFVPVHLHPNNFRQTVSVAGLEVPPLLEITYLRRDRCRSMSPQRRYPHPLDRDCVQSRPAVHVPASLIA